MSDESNQARPQAVLEDPRGKTIQPVADRYVSVQEGYRRWAQSYDRDPNPLLALEERQLRPRLPSLNGKRVLDLACGTGRWLKWLLGKGVRLGVGVDISQSMLARARQKSGLRNRLVRGDCCHIPFPAASFDFVMCSFALSHVSSLECAVGEIRRVTASGAIVCVSDLHPQAYERGWRTGFRDDHGPAEIMTWPRSTHDLLEAWKTVGLVCLEKAEFRLGEAERPIFARAGKGHLFEEACEFPSVQIFHMLRLD